VTAVPGKVRVVEDVSVLADGPIEIFVDNVGVVRARLVTKDGNGWGGKDFRSCRQVPVEGSLELPSSGDHFWNIGASSFSLPWIRFG
jgi:hypothetical protein